MTIQCPVCGSDIAVPEEVEGGWVICRAGDGGHIVSTTQPKAPKELVRRWGRRTGEGSGADTEVASGAEVEPPAGR